MSGIIGKKVGMTRVFTDTGESIPVTVIEAGPCVVVSVRTEEKNSYAALQLGFAEVSEKRITKPRKGQFDKHELKPMRYLREFRGFEDVSSFSVGDELKVDQFEVGEIVKVTGVSKGKGFQGVMKRHGFGGGPKTHGQSDRPRAPGSIGQSSYPSRVLKGIKMAGKTGRDRVTVRNLEVVVVDLENNVLMVRGAVPGAKDGLVMIQK